jgi:hypothetical protein
MKYLTKYKIFENITEEEESMIIDDLNDIFHDIRDQNLEVIVTSERKGRVIGDSIRVEIHGTFNDSNVQDMSVPTFKLGDVTDAIYRTEEFLKPHNYIIQPIFAIKVHIGGGKRKDTESQFIKLDELENYYNKECSHVSLNWRIPISYEEMTKRLRGNPDD